MSAENAWRIAMEAAARRFDKDAILSESLGDADTAEICRLDAGRLRSLPMPPAFRAAVEAEMGEVVERTAAEILRKINRAEAEIEEYIEDDTGLAPLEAALEELSAARALLSRLEAKGESHE